MREAVQFEAMLCSHNWVGWAFLNPNKSGRVLLVNAADLAVFSPAVRRQFLLTHLSPSISASDAVSSLAKFPALAETHLFSVGSTSKTLRHLSSWALSGSPVDSRPIRKALKGQISFLTNNLIVTPPKPVGLVPRSALSLSLPIVHNFISRSSVFLRPTRSRHLAEGSAEKTHRAGRCRQRVTGRLSWLDECRSEGL